MRPFQILCFGDSNTWGYAPVSAMRYPRDIRWTGVMASQLGSRFNVVEEGQNGRTTVWNDPLEGGHKNGLTYLPACLESHHPIDLVILMLGTNDFQSMHPHNAWHAAQGMGTLITAIRTAPIEPGMPVPPILVVAPPPIGAGFHDAVMGDGCVEKSKGVAGWYKIIAERNNVHFLDAEGCEFNQIDFMHLTRKGHAQLAEKLAELVPTLL